MVRFTMKKSVSVQKKFSSRPDSKGVALIMVLWVIAILSVVVLEFSYAMRTEFNITRNYQEELQLYAMAEGGVERAVAELVYKQDPKIQEFRKNLSVEETSPEKKEWVTDGRNYTIPFERGECTIRVIGESGKININLVSEGLLRKIVRNLGLEGEAGDTVVDSILDWRDPDDLHRINGAENEYYQGLKEPYNCKNGNLDCIEELLLIRGVTPELFYGKKITKTGEEEIPEPVGLKDIFTIYSNGEKIDINSATLPVLRVVLGIPYPTAQLILKARDQKAFESQVDLLQRVPELSTLDKEISGLLVYRADTPYYTVESKARTKGAGDSVRGLKAIIKVDLKEKGGHKIVQWVDLII